MFAIRKLYFQNTFLFRGQIIFACTEQPVIYAFKKLDSRNEALSIATYDFSTLHANFPQNKLKKVMRELINLARRNSLCHDKICATCTDNENQFKVTFDKNSFKLAIDFILDNCFFNFG